MEPSLASCDAYSLNCNINNSNDPTAIATYRKALERIEVVSKFHIAYLEMVIARERRYLDFLPSMIAPDLFLNNLEKEQSKAMLTEWGRELDMHRRLLNRKMKRLETILPYLPEE
jgi:hypothetical protein